MSEIRVITGSAGLEASVGEELGLSDWRTIDQAMIDAFAEVTGDKQWIHVDPERAATESPFGGTIAHGFLTLSLLPSFAATVYDVEGFTAKLNYGLEKVRFTRPVLSGSRIRDRITLDRIEQVRAGIRGVFLHTVEIENGDKPACVAEYVIVFTS